MRVRIALESVWPGLAVHADSGTIAACIAESRVERQRARLRIEGHHEQTVFAVFARVQNDSATVCSAAIQCGFCLSSKVIRETSRMWAKSEMS